MDSAFQFHISHGFLSIILRAGKGERSSKGMETLAVTFYIVYHFKKA